MNQALPEMEQIQLARSEIAQAREHLRLASDALSKAATEVTGENSPGARPAEAEETPGDLLDFAREIIEQVLPRPLAQKAKQDGAGSREWLTQVYIVSLAPRGIDEPVATLVGMLAAVKFGLRHQLLLQTEKRLGLAHKRPIAQLDRFLESFVSQIIEADVSDARFNDWLRRTVQQHYPGFRNGNRLDLPNGGALRIPEVIEPIRLQPAAPIAASALRSPVDPASAVIIPPGSGWRITLGYAQVLNDENYPAFHGKRHSGIDIFKWDAYQAPVHAMRAGVVIDAAYLPKGFGNTVVVEHADKTCLRYTHLDKILVKKGDRIVGGQQIGTVGKGAKQIYPAHLHLDMPRSKTYARARTYYDSATDVAERFINPLSWIPAAI